MRKTSLAILLSLALVFTFQGAGFAQNMTDTDRILIHDPVEYGIGETVVLDNVEVVTDNLITVTTAISETDEELPNSTKANPERLKTKVFSHQYFDRNGTLMATAIVTVPGIYSPASSEFYLTSVSGYFTGNVASSFAGQGSVNGANGYFSTTFNGLPSETFTYSINSSGNIQN